MPILVQNIVDQLQAALDSESSERYLFDQDYKPAINSAIDVTVALFNQAFAENKLSPEQLRELMKVRVWQANGYSRIAYNEADTNEPLWTMVAVYPLPVTNKNGGVTSTGGDKSVSIFRPDLSYISSQQSAKRLTMEEWNENQNNPFMPGNTTLAGGLAEYAYLDFADYTSSSYAGNGGTPEITIRPDVSNSLVALAYLKSPDKVSVIGDTLEFPESLTRLISDAALNYISIKQGDPQNLFAISRQNVQLLVSLMK